MSVSSTDKIIFNIPFFSNKNEFHSKERSWNRGRERERERESQTDRETNRIVYFLFTRQLRIVSVRITLLRLNSNVKKQQTKVICKSLHSTSNDFSYICDLCCSISIILAVFLLCPDLMNAFDILDFLSVPFT